MNRYAKFIERLLYRVLGSDSELEDVLQETFMSAFSKLHTLRDRSQFKSWLTRIAVFTARGLIRSRKRRRWLSFVSPDNLPENQQVEFQGESSRRVKAVYEVLGEMATNESIAFSLRFIEEMTLTETATALGVSLATAKRRLRQAKKNFQQRARRHSLLFDYLSEVDTE